MTARKTLTEPRETGPAERARLLALINAAEDIFLAKGYHTATMSDVAKAAGMSKKTVYTLIESKAELFAELLAHYQSMLQLPTPQSDWTIRDSLIANLTCLARFLLSPQQIAILRLIMAEYTHSPDFGRVFHNSRVKKAKTELENCIAEFTKSQGYTSSQAKDMAAMLFGMAIGEFHLGTLIGFRSTPSKQNLEKRIHHAVDIFLAGCCAK